MDKEEAIISAITEDLESDSGWREWDADEVVQAVISGYHHYSKESTDDRGGT